MTNKINIPVFDKIHKLLKMCSNYEEFTFQDQQSSDSEILTITFGDQRIGFRNSLGKVNMIHIHDKIKEVTEDIGITYYHLTKAMFMYPEFFKMEMSLEAIMKKVIVQEACLYMHSQLQTHDLIENTWVTKDQCQIISGLVVLSPNLPNGFIDEFGLGDLKWTLSDLDTGETLDTEVLASTILTGYDFFFRIARGMPTIDKSCEIPSSSLISYMHSLPIILEVLKILYEQEEDGSFIIKGGVFRHSVMRKGKGYIFRSKIGYGTLVDQTVKEDYASLYEYLYRFGLITNNKLKYLEVIHKCLEADIIENVYNNYIAKHSPTYSSLSGDTINLLTDLDDISVEMTLRPVMNCKNEIESFNITVAGPNSHFIVTADDIQSLDQLIETMFVSQTKAAAIAKEMPEVGPRKIDINCYIPVTKEEKNVQEVDTKKVIQLSKFRNPIMIKNRLIDMANMLGLDSRIKEPNKQSLAIRSMRGIWYTYRASDISGKLNVTTEGLDPTEEHHLILDDYVNIMISFADRGIIDLGALHRFGAEDFERLYENELYSIIKDEFSQYNYENGGVFDGPHMLGTISKNVKCGTNGCVQSSQIVFTDTNENETKFHDITEFGDYLKELSSRSSCITIAYDYTPEKSLSYGEGLTAVERGESFETNCLGFFNHNFLGKDKCSDVIIHSKDGKYISLKQVIAKTTLASSDNELWLLEQFLAGNIAWVRNPVEFGEEYLNE